MGAKSNESAGMTPQIDTAWKAEVTRTPQIDNPWITELVKTTQTPPAISPGEELKRAVDASKNLETIINFFASSDPETRRRIEMSRTDSAIAETAFTINPKEKIAMRKELQEYLKLHNKPAYDELKKLDSAEANLLKGGKKTEKELAGVRKLQDSFYNPYGPLLELGNKNGIPVILPSENSSDFMKGPYVGLPTESGVQYKVGENFKLYLKDRKDPANDLDVISRIKNMAAEFSDLRNPFGMKNLVLADSNNKLEVKLSYSENQSTLELNVNLNRTLKEQLENIRSAMVTKISKDYNLDIASEGSRIIFNGQDTGKQAVAPTIPQLKALSQAMDRAKVDIPPDSPPIKVYWGPLGPDGLFHKFNGYSNIYLSPETSTANLPGTSVSAATYVAIHELGHLATASLKNQEKQTAEIAEAFGWKKDGNSEYLVDEKGNKICFQGYKYNPQDPLKPTLELDQWIQGCPSEAAKWAAGLLGDKGNSLFPTINRTEIAKELKLKPFTDYYWNIEETAVEALTAFQAGEQTRANLARLNPTAYERAAALDKYLIARYASKPPSEPFLVRMEDGKIEAATTENLRHTSEWERKFFPKR